MFTRIDITAIRGPGTQALSDKLTTQHIPVHQITNDPRRNQYRIARSEWLTTIQVPCLRSTRPKIIIIIIIIFSNELGPERPVLATSNSPLKGLPSRLRPFDLQFSIIFGDLLLFILVTCSYISNSSPFSSRTLNRVMKTNLMHYLSSVYFVNQPLHVSGISVAHHQEVYCLHTTIGTCCAF